MTDALSAFQTLLQMGDGLTPEGFDTIAEVRTIGGPSLTLDTTDVTSHDSADAFEEVLPTILRSGTITFELNYLPTDSTHDVTDGFLHHLDARTLCNFRLVFPDALLEADRSAIALRGYVTGFSPTANHDGALTGSVTIKPTSVVTPFGEWILNGAFTANADYWTPKDDAVLSSVAGGQAGNCLQVENGDAVASYASQAIETHIGGIYKIELHHKDGSHGSLVKVGTTEGDDDLVASGALTNANWTLFEDTFTATTTITYVSLVVNDATLGSTTLFDTVSVTGPYGG